MNRVMLLREKIAKLTLPLQCFVAARLPFLAGLTLLPRLALRTATATGIWGLFERIKLRRPTQAGLLLPRGGRGRPGSPPALACLLRAPGTLRAASLLAPITLMQFARVAPISHSLEARRCAAASRQANGRAS